MTSVNPFPLQADGLSALYLGLYVLTLAAHAAFIGYVLAGTGYAAATALRPRSAPRDPIAEVLRDWLPFALGCGITAGVAPLLFVQILYQQRLYTANLLLFHRWMAVVPALITGFYLLYLHKSERVQRPALRVLVAATAAACFVFTAWSWTENHLLSLDDAVWRDFYAASHRFYRSDALLPRLGLWLASSLPLMATGAAWQVRSAAPGEAPLRRLSRLALIGIAAAAAMTAWSWQVLDPDARRMVLARPFVPWWVALAIGAAVAIGGYLALWRRPASRRALIAATGGVALALVSGAVVREAPRLIHLEALRPRVESAGGMPLFLLVLGVATAAIVAVAVLVRRGLAAR